MRGQMTNEFIIVLAAIMIVFFIFYSLYADQWINSRQSSEKIAAMSTAIKIRNAINYVYLAGDGTTYNTSYRVGDMNISIHDGVVWAQTNVAAYYVPLLTSNINTTSFHGGEVVIKNNKGLIEIA